ncbi:carcinustatin peptide [Ostertagia ostertagi]
MIQHHKCEFGDMVQFNEVWSTSNPLVIDWPSAPFGCCAEHSISVSNCILVRTVVHMRHGATSPDSPAGNLGQCAMKPVIVSCGTGPYSFGLPMRRRRAVLHRDSKEFALSWRDASDRIQDCGAQFILSDQGYAVAPLTRLPRSASADAGIVTSNQLAAQLLAVEGSVGSAVSALFHHALSALCDRTNLLAFALHTSLAASLLYPYAIY